MGHTSILQFQSRNRGTFGFKHGFARLSEPVPCVSISESRCFWFQVMEHNIEIRITVQFQSRNRGTFGFKWITYGQDQELYIGFNLVIEVLLVSS